MASALPGAILLLAVATLGLCAWRASAVAHCGRALTYIVALGLLLRSFAAADLVLHPWDERFHAVVAKNLARHPLVPTLYDDPALPYDATNWGATQPVEAMFYTPWPAYSSIPSPQQVHELTARGYHVPLMIARHPDVRLVRLQPSEARDQRGD